jgi:imidazole glycerol phosphate synthase glutamine amidotransferase subunit
MARGRVTVLRTGAANLASVLAAFRRLGWQPELATRAEQVAAADRLVVPGVGAFAPVMATLVDAGVDQALRERITVDRPTLGICLGLQILAEASEEGEGCRGLGILPVTVRRFPDTVVVPQLGWNRVSNGAGSALLRAGAAYFANSYRIDRSPPGWAVSWSDHGGPFVAGVARGAVLGCQFHPELSGAWGADLLARWLEVPSC